LEEVYLACGLSWIGFKISPAAGARLVELILDGESNTVDITPSVSSVSPKVNCSMANTGMGITGNKNP
jgi:glycine/D-amino acid oxidase-like deaminating enzyme